MKQEALAWSLWIKNKERLSMRADQAQWIGVKFLKKKVIASRQFLNMPN
jgi:hypothetical protein